MQDKSKVEFDELADQFAAEIRSGACANIDAYVRLYPEHASEIRRLFPVLQMMEAEAVAVANVDSEADLLAAELQQLDSACNEKLGDYRIVREIGRGGMGLVFEAHQESLDRRVALKLLPDSARFDTRRLKRFEQEAMAAAQLHHTNIVPVFGIGKHRETSYFVMQYIEGQTIDNVLTELSRVRSREVDQSTKVDAHADTMASTIASKISSAAMGQQKSGSRTGRIGIPSQAADKSGTNGQRDSGKRDSGKSESGINNSATIVDESENDRAFFQNIAFIGTQVADALAHAHSKKILHRDIKPSNLMLDLAGNTWVTDFGLAKSFESPDLTRTGEVVGTLRYMSPEQLNGTADERSDIFGLGLTLYELAALTPAYDGHDRAELMKQAIAASPRRLRQINPGIPRDLETIIHKCVASEPNRRYQNANELKSDLERFRQGEPILARRINPIQRLAKWCQRQPVIATLAAALMLALMGGIAATTWQWQKTTDALNLAQQNLNQVKNEREKTDQALQLANSNLAEAQKQTKIAKDHFRQVRDSVNRFFTVIGQQRLLQEPGMHRLRIELLQEAINYHKDFVARYQDDDSLKTELGQSLYFICNIAFAMDPASNAEQIDQAVAIFRELNEADPENESHGLWLARCLTSKGKLTRRRNAQAALKLTRDAADILEDIVDTTPESLAAREELATIYQTLGLAYESMERATQETGRSFEYYTRSFQLRKEIAKQVPEDINNTILLGDIHRDLGITYRRQGKLKLAEENYLAAKKILSKVVAANPEHMAARKTLGSIANSIAYFYCHGGAEFVDYEVALQYYDLSRQQYLFLSENNPMIFEFKDGLARTALGMGSIFQAQKKLQLAYEQRKIAADIREKLCAQNPGAFHLRSSWAMSLNGLGATQRDLGQIQQAIETHQRAHFQHAKAVEQDPGMPVLRLRLISGLLQLSRVQAKVFDFEKALSTINQIDQFTLPQFSKPRFDKGTELTLLACKIAMNLRDKKPESETAELLVEQCLKQARTEFSKANELKFNVVQAAAHHQDIQKFAAKHPEAKSMLEWIESQFKEQD